MNLNELNARLRASNPEGWYIFAGEEDYLKRHYLGALRKCALGEDTGFEIFNHVVFEAQDMELGALAEAIESPPMMADFKLIEWRFASFSQMNESTLRTLEEEIFPLKRDFPSSVFAIMTTEDGLDLGTEKRPSRLAKLLGGAFDILNFPKSTDNQLLSWLKKHFDANGIRVSLDSLNTMIMRVGHSMENLSREVDKLSAYLKANERDLLTREDVELVCPASAECDAFAIQNSIIEGDVEKAFRALTDMKMRRTEPQVVIGMLAKTYSTLSSVSLLADEGESFDGIRGTLGLSSYPLQLYLKAAKKLGTKRINASLEALLRADAASKMGGIAGYEAIEMFITQNI